MILDSCAAVTAEREGKNARQLLEGIILLTGDADVAISVITALELAHGIARADTSRRFEKRQRFLNELLAVVPVQPVTLPIALRAGQIDGESGAAGVCIPFSDLPIGVTALELGYSALTHTMCVASGSLPV